jgi:hypothetical protein
MGWLLKSMDIDPYANWHSPYIACYQDEDVARAELAEIKEEIAKFGTFMYVSIHEKYAFTTSPPLYIASKLNTWFPVGVYRSLFFAKLILIEIPSR